MAAVAGAGCAGTKTYNNGINHCYLCAVKVARLNGYEIREQEFHPNKGELIAARSVPDPKEMKISRGFFRRTWEVLWNLWDNGKFELWDEDLAGARVKTENRFTVSFTNRVRGPLGWLGVNRPRETRLEVELDTTDYGREDWVINRTDLSPAEHARLYREIGDCLAYASPTAYLTAAKKGRAPAAAPAVQVPAAAATLAAASSSTVTTGAAAVAFAAPASTLVASSAVSPAPAVETPAVRAPAPMSAEAEAELLAKGRGSYEAGKYDEAIPVLEQVAAADSDNAESRGYLGAAYYQKRRLEDSIRAYEEYLRLVPSDTRTQSFLEEIRKEKAQPR